MPHNVYIVTPSLKWLPTIAKGNTLPQWGKNDSAKHQYAFPTLGDNLLEFFYTESTEFISIKAGVKLYCQ